MYCEAARWSALSIRLFWKITGCGALMIASRVSRGSPRSAALQAIAPPQSWPTSANRSSDERVGERENVVDQQVGLISLDLLRPVRPGKAALVGHDEEEAILEPRRDLAPGAVRFGKAVEQDDRRVRRIAGQRDIQRHAGAKRNRAGTRSRIADRLRHLRKRDEFLVVAGDQREAQRLPVLLRLVDPVARRGDEVPEDVAAGGERLPPISIARAPLALDSRASWPGRRT